MKTDTQIMNELAVSSRFLKPQSEEESKAQLKGQMLPGTGKRN